MVDKLKRFILRLMGSIRYRLTKVTRKIIGASNGTKSYNAAEPEHIGPVHALENNYFLSKEQHAYCIVLADRVQQLYDGTLNYIERSKLDQALFLAVNEWADIVP